MGFLWLVEAHLSRWRPRPSRPQGQPQIAWSVPSRVAVLCSHLLPCILPELTCPRDRAMGSSGSLPPPTEGRRAIQGQPWGLSLLSDRQEEGVGWRGSRAPAAPAPDLLLWVLVEGRKLEDPPYLPQPQSVEARGQRGRREGRRTT